jgi:ATP-binding cassette subfamily B multidrug efflux pump
VSDSRDQPERQRLQPRMMRRGPGARGIVEKAKNPIESLKRLLRYMGTYRLYLSLAIALTGVSTMLNLLGPYLIGVAIDQYIIPGDWNGLLRISLAIGGAYLLNSVTDMTVGWVMANVSQGSLKRLRKDFFEHVQNLSLSFFDTASSGDLMSRLTNDVETIGVVLSQNVTELTRSVTLLTGVIVAMFLINHWLALASLLVFPIMIILTAVVGKKTRSYFMALQRSMGRLNGVMQETLTGQKAVIAFGQQKSANRRFRKSNKEVKERGVRAETYAMTLPPLTGILGNVNIAIVAGVGSWMALQGLATIGTISAFIAYSRRFADPLHRFSNVFNSVQSALAGAERVFEILDVEPEILDSADALPVDRFEGDVEFRDVEFSYVPSVKVIKDMGFRAEPGQLVAIVGPTGAGKTTMVNILSRFYDIQGGSISIDDRDIREYRKDDLRRQLGVVLQDVFLFSGTVMDNIRYGKLDATDEEVFEAAKLANADSFIRRLPQGYYTLLSERAGNLSQGQRQLISIARAILADPSILILDEATSSVDTRTEIQIQEALHRLMKDRTSFVIAHRLSTIRNADTVLVINHGEIIERGTHEELMEKKGFYYNLYMSQFKETIDDADFEYIKPVEQPEPIQPQAALMPGMRGGRGMGRGMGGGIRGKGSLEMMHQRIMEVLNIFKKNGITSAETAKTKEELGLPPYFSTMMENRLKPLGVVVERDNRYYLVEENIEKLTE